MSGFESLMDLEKCEGEEIGKMGFLWGEGEGGGNWECRLGDDGWI